jgi:hypothetical protein
MARYIDSDKLEKHFIEDVSKHNLTINGNDYPVFLADHTLHEIRNAPTADVVEVVRCKDCCYANDHASICHYGVGREVTPDHYCGYGEKRCDNE